MKIGILFLSLLCGRMKDMRIMMVLSGTEEINQIKTTKY